MVEFEVIKTNPAKKVKVQKDDVKIDVFSDEQIRQMLKFYRKIKQHEKSYVAYRDYMVIVTILGTGIRWGELINFHDLLHSFNSINSIGGKCLNCAVCTLSGKIAHLSTKMGISIPSNLYTRIPAIWSFFKPSPSLNQNLYFLHNYYKIQVVNLEITC
nr:hypothetical protein [uncultured Bacillus sp.]